MLKALLVATVLIGALSACASDPATNPAIEPLAATPAATCDDTRLDDTFDEILLRPVKPDPVRLDYAVLVFVNQVRCRSGLAPLAPGSAELLAAELHVRDMGTRGFFSHQSPVPGRETLAARLGQAGASYQTAAENIADGFFLNFMPGTRLRQMRPASCAFQDENGQPLRQHTYRTLAQSMVQRWMDSPPHARNIMNPAHRMQGFAIAPNGNTNLCGGLYAVQVLSG